MTDRCWTPDNVNRPPLLNIWIPNCLFWPLSQGSKFRISGPRTPPPPPHRVRDPCSATPLLHPGKAKVTFDLSRLRSRLRLHLNAETGADGLLTQASSRVYQCRRYPRFQRNATSSTVYLQKQMKHGGQSNLRSLTTF
jgi:hypothetical protein